jgi:hypothetical protein
MGTISQGRDLYKCLLFVAVMMIVMPQLTAAEKVQEKSQEQEAMAIINHATSAWQNLMQDPDMAGFRAHVKGGQGVLIVLGAEGGNGGLLVRHDMIGRVARVSQSSSFRP